MIEEVTTPPWKYAVEGQITAAGWFMRLESLKRPDEGAVEVYFNDRNEDRILGYVTGYDLERRPFCSFTILSRKPPTEQEFYEGYRQYKDSFYCPEDGKEIAK